MTEFQLEASPTETAMDTMLNTIKKLTTNTGRFYDCNHLVLISSSTSFFVIALKFYLPRTLAVFAG
jgi:hypothetical protein